MNVAKVLKNRFFSFDKMWSVYDIGGNVFEFVRKCIVVHAFICFVERL